MKNRVEEERVREFFSPGGLLEQGIEGFEVRPTQTQLALKVVKAMQEERFLIAEAGTGIGKTFSYLIPGLALIEEGKGPFIVSTYTKNLQQQLFKKDVPLILSILKKPYKYALLMGRRNYVCRFRLSILHMKSESLPKGLLPRIYSWLEETEEGSYEEWPFQQYRHIWSLLCADGEVCKGQFCSFQKQCFVQKARQRCQDAHIIIINHALFFSDLEVQTEGEGGLLPKYEYILFDEAHNLEAAGIDSFRQQFAQIQLENWFKEARTLVRQVGEDVEVQLQQLMQNLLKDGQDLSSSFFFSLANRVRTKEKVLLEEGWWEELHGVPERMAQVLNNLHKVFKTLGQYAEEEQKDPIKEKTLEAKKLEASLLGFMDMNRDEQVVWVEKGNAGLSLESLPLRIHEYLARLFFPTIKSAVFTSATLSVNGEMTYFKRALGFPDERTDSLVLPSPFYYEEQAKVLLPHDLPPPGSSDFPLKSMAHIERLLPYCGPGILMLFTSYAMLHSFKDLCWGSETLKEYKILAQGEASHNSLIAQFKEADQAILLGTSSFWEGVDLPGHLLTTLILVRLPFPVPDDPWIAGKSRQLQEMGQNPFYHLMLPKAILRFKQGWGRLIRSFRDRGLLIVLDGRIIQKGYGSLFLKALPDTMPVEKGTVHELLQEARSFW